MNVINPSYELVKSKVPAMPWDDYKQLITTKLNLLLDNQVRDEREYQRLIELHPCLLPWIYGTFGGGHHGLIHGAVITQPRLTGLIQARQPDFLMIVRDTDSVYAVLVEIESPCKRWFTQDGQPTAELTQSMNQLRQWKFWFDQTGNKDRFLSEYQIPPDFRARRRFQQRYILIYGRRAELESSGQAGMRSQHQLPDERFISYDHLYPSEEYRDAITVKVDGVGYHAVFIQPTLRLSPFSALDHVDIQGKETAVLATPDFPKDRGEFLRSRWSYWDEWALSSGNKCSRSSDYE